MNLVNFAAQFRDLGLKESRSVRPAQMAQSLGMDNAFLAHLQCAISPKMPDLGLRPRLLMARALGAKDLCSISYSRPSPLTHSHSSTTDDASPS